MKYILDGSNLCCQIYLSQYVFCANHTRMVSVKNGIFCRNALYIGIAWLRLLLFENEKIRMVFTGVSLLASPCKQIFCTGDQNKNVFEGETTFYGFVMDVITNPYLPVRAAYIHGLNYKETSICQFFMCQPNHIVVGLVQIIHGLKIVEPVNKF